MLQFDDKTHTVNYSGQFLSLPPLSYRLLKALAQSTEQVLSVSDLMPQVWVNTQVSPETLKQRVFVLRKALEEAGFNTLSIQAIRGEGYRLLIDEPEFEVSPVSESGVESTIVNQSNPALAVADHPFSIGLDKLKTLPHAWRVAGLAGLMAAVLLGVWFFVRTPDFTINNRVLLWSNLPLENMTVEGRTAFEAWRSLISEENPQGQLQLIFSSRINTMSVPIQARKDRAGLISHFEWLNNYQGNAVRLSIIEPRTATVLRSDVINLSLPREIPQALKAQQQAIRELIYSQRLCLTKAQRENSQAPIWQELRQLANQS